MNYLSIYLSLAEIIDHNHRKLSEFFIFWLIMLYQTIFFYYLTLSLYLRGYQVKISIKLIQWLPTFFTFLWASSFLYDVGTYQIPPEKIRKHFLKEVPRGSWKHLKLIMFLQQCTVNTNRISFFFLQQIWLNFEVFFLLSNIQNCVFQLDNII